jgi:hypothetical protein
MFANRIAAWVGVLWLSAFPALAGDWPQFRGDPSLSGVAKGSLPGKPVLLWTFKTGGSVKSTAAIVQERVYVGSDDESLYAVQLADGKKIWSTKIGGAVESSPLVLEGKVYVGSSDGSLYGSDLVLGFSPGLSNWDYNRVEGLVLGGEVSYGRADERARLSAFGGYATAPEDFRYRVAFKTTLPATKRKASLVASFRDRVEPFGSNRPALNSLRAFVGGADDQDYARRLGGSARVVVTPSHAVSFDVGFEGVRESSVATDEDFSIFGDMNQVNPSIDEGDEHAIVAGVHVDAPHWMSTHITQRVAGGDLGGDFRYNRTDISIRARGFVVGRQELEATLLGVATGDAPPLQELADVGGLSTVRGYERRTHVGNHSFAARLEYLVPYDVFGYTHIPLLQSLNVQMVPWADAGRVGEGDSMDWIRSAGIGLQRYLWPVEDAANLRLDFAFPFDNPSSDFAVYLWFVAFR